MSAYLYLTALMPLHRSNSTSLIFRFFSIHDTEEIIRQARSVGDGFILKDKVVEMLPQAVDALLRKQPFFPPEPTGQ